LNNNKDEQSRLIGLEAVRALAILGVLFYHLNLTGFFNAGFLGVDIFFNLSGFLITGLLLREYAQKEAINIGAFYLRRFRRLFPACAFLILAWVVLTPIYLPEAYERLCQDILAAFFYVSNWWQIYSKQSYFETFGHPPLLQHLWSLAVEEQFYIFWPLTLWMMLRLASVRTIGFICIGLAILSTAWMSYVYEVKVDGGDPSRAYLASDTHAMGLLMGAALACFWSPWRAREPRLLAWVEKWRVSLVLGSMLPLLGILITWHEGHPILFHGGFLLTSLITLVLIVALTDLEADVFIERPAIHKVVQCVRWIGTRSYSIYLWHWPIFIAWHVGPDMPWTTVVFCFALTAFAAELSYRLIERPFQKMNFKELFRNYRFTMTGITTVFVVSASLVMAEPIRISYASVLAQEPSSAQEEINTPSPVVAEVEKTNSKTPVEAVAKTQSIKNVSTREFVKVERENKKMIVVGDSVMLGASDFLTRNIPNVAVDAQVGRQAHQGLQVIKKLRKNNPQIDYAVIHLGTNGYIVESQFKQILNELSDLKHVTVLNVYANRRWMDPNNELIERVTKNFPNANVVNWYGMGKDNPQFFVSDGIHLTGQGIAELVRAISRDAGIPMRTFSQEVKVKRLQAYSMVRPKTGNESKLEPTQATDMESKASSVTVRVEEKTVIAPSAIDNREDK